MKANEGKKKPAMHDKKHHSHVAAYLKGDLKTDVLKATTDVTNRK